jgi:hypothetical protein
MRSFASLLRKMDYREDLGEGFIIDRFREHNLEARYVKRIKLDETSIDPFGNVLLSSRIAYSHVKFLASYDEVGLELVNPPIGIRDFTNKLSEILDYSISFSQIEVDVLRWCSLIENKVGDEYFAGSMQLSGIRLDEEAVAKAVIISRSDVRNSAERFIADRPRKIEKIKLQSSARLSESILLTQTGTATFGKTESQTTIDLVRSTLLGALV